MDKVDRKSEGYVNNNEERMRNEDSYAHLWDSADIK